MISKVHHCMVDGIGGISLLMGIVLFLMALPAGTLASVFGKRDEKSRDRNNNR